MFEVAILGMHLTLLFFTMRPTGRFSTTWDALWRNLKSQMSNLPMAIESYKKYRKMAIVMASYATLVVMLLILNQFQHNMADIFLSLTQI